MPIPPLVQGHLPPGRHTCDLSEAQQTFVLDANFARSSTRHGLWEQFGIGLQLLNEAAVVYQLWLGGSFTSQKLDPGDVDVTFLIDGRDHFSRSDSDRKVIESFIENIRNPATGERIMRHGLPLDTFVVDWWPWEPRLDLPDQPWGAGKYNRYIKDHGLWDDWWQRRRAGSKTDPPLLEDALPRRGFLEVNLREFAI